MSTCKYKEEVEASLKAVMMCSAKPECGKAHAISRCNSARRLCRIHMFWSMQHGLQPLVVRPACNVMMP